MHDTLSSVFLTCFLFGAVFTLLSVLTGAAHIPVPGGHGLHLPHAGAHAPAAHAAHSAHGSSQNRATFSNAGSLLAFVTWFGGVGYLLHALSPLTLLLVILLALIAGLAGATLLGLFLVKVLLPAQTFTDPEVYQLEGATGRITARIVQGGTGEITYSRAGTRRSDAARSIDGEPIDRNEEVVILAYKRGIAYVQSMTKYLTTSARDISAQLAALKEPAATTEGEGGHTRSSTE